MTNLDKQEILDLLNSKGYNFGVQEYTTQPQVLDGKIVYDETVTFTATKHIEVNRP